MVSPEGEEAVNFDTESGDSDSLMDAHRKFSEVCYQMRMDQRESAVVRLYENGILLEQGPSRIRPETGTAKIHSMGNTVKKKEKKNGRLGKGVFTDSMGKEILAAKNAYLLYCAEHRPAVQAGLETKAASEDQDVKDDETELGLEKTSNHAAKKAIFGEVTRQLSQMWAALDEAARAPWTEAASADKARFEAAMASNPANAQVIATRKEAKACEKRRLLEEAGLLDGQAFGVRSIHHTAEGKAKRVKAARLLDSDENEVKAPVSAYIHFCVEKRPEVVAEMKSQHEEHKVEASPSSIQQSVMAKLGELWRALGDRAAYDEMARNDKERYDNAVASNPANAEYIRLKARRTADKEERAKRSAKAQSGSAQ
eukprot:CAMPEP_0172633378 /NCGR_PEP_ID=MMETSP1068-20121228/189083_1 /TAXON_ID=35684 /ORGANISM="Pseudopedinella elastica, Strain CCMP716" /LENGTH=368 /DNA_ID=CAMNT_0013445055 /DNA_START=232 /DNA_END=1338 /DNA_ORIENTATION=-